MIIPPNHRNHRRGKGRSWNKATAGMGAEI